MAINRSTPENFVYDNTSKINKNFVYKNLKRSKCYNCDFSGSNFSINFLILSLNHMSPYCVISI